MQIISSPFRSTIHPANTQLVKKRMLGWRKNLIQQHHRVIEHAAPAHCVARSPNNSCLSQIDTVIVKAMHGELPETAVFCRVCVSVSTQQKQILECTPVYVLQDIRTYTYVHVCELL